MRENYKVQGLTIGRYRCVSINSYDKCFSGELGEIWESGTPGTLKAFKVLPSGCEKIFTFDIKDLDKWVLKLKVSPNLDDQLHWANNPNLRESK